MNTETYILRPLMALGGAIGLYSSSINIFSDLGYTKTVMCIYISIFSFIILTSAIHSRFKEFFALAFPFLSENLQKGIFLILFSFLCFGREMETSGILAGLSLLFDGCGYLAFELSYTPPIVKTTPSNYEPPDLLPN